MALPRIIESLLTIRREGGGGPLVTQGQTQIIINFLPPGRTVILQEYPYQGDYLNIVFMVAFDPANVPNAFYAWGSYFGARMWEGIAHSWWMSNNIDAFIFITEAEPASALIFNRSPVAQFYGATGSHLVVKNAEDFDLMYEQIAWMATSKKADSLAIEANNLLGQIKNKGYLNPSE